jgi:threonyl-tRNA synthetase
VLGDPERPIIEKRIESIVKESQRFERVVVTRDEALAMFQENKFKVRQQQHQHQQQGLLASC